LTFGLDCARAMRIRFDRQRFMTMPDRQQKILRSGKPLAAEITASRQNFRAFVMVIPQVPDPRETPEAWIHWGHRPGPNEGGVIRLKDPSFISGFEIRYLEHHAKYADAEWGWDYDYALDDQTTRAQRAYVKSEDEIAAAIAPWLEDLSQLQEPENFDSSLVNNPIERYLDLLEERPHLWDTP
ncbi:MAG TPA: hypothetical protein VIM99_07210, partial [Blastocatellia bacterium]